MTTKITGGVDLGLKSDVHMVAKGLGAQLTEGGASLWPAGSVPESPEVANWRRKVEENIAPTVADAQRYSTASYSDTNNISEINIFDESLEKQEEAGKLNTLNNEVRNYWNFIREQAEQKGSCERYVTSKGVAIEKFSFGGETLWVASKDGKKINEMLNRDDWGGFSRTINESGQIEIHHNSSNSAITIIKDGKNSYHEVSENGRNLALSQWLNQGKGWIAAHIDEEGKIHITEAKGIFPENKWMVHTKGAFFTCDNKGNVSLVEEKALPASITAEQRQSHLQIKQQVEQGAVKMDQFVAPYGKTKEEKNVNTMPETDAARAYEKAKSKNNILER